MSKYSLSKETAYKIYNGDYFGLYKLEFAGNYGEYILFRVIYSDNCQLFCFNILQNRDIVSEYKFENINDNDEVVIKLMEHKITFEQKIVEIE